MGRSLLFNLADVEEQRAAVVEDGRLAEFAVETSHRVRRQGDIHLGRVTRIEASVGAAFVDIGAERSGFLHASDVMPQYLDGGEEFGAFERRPHGDGADITALLREGQRVLVQVTRDSLGTKGPALTTFVSLPGRWLVLMPSLERIGVSRRIEDPDERLRMRDAVQSLDPPPGMGFIVRTAGAGRTPDELRRDYDVLLERFRGLLERARTATVPVCLWREGDLLLRTLRDWLAEPVDEVWIDTDEGHRKALEFLEEASPPWAHRLHRYEGGVPLFSHRGVEEAVDRLFERRVPLAGGGFLLIEPTEALVSIDVNSGKSRAAADLEETALQTDLLAAEEVARQVRLRDLGGVIVVDFIDVREPANRARLDEAVAAAFARDRARVRIAPLSEFGLVQITRKRTGPSHRQQTHAGCPGCGGKGVVLTPSSAALRALRELRAQIGGGGRGAVLRAAPEVMAWLQTHKAEDLRLLNAAARDGVELREDRDLWPAGFEVR
jgi:ribonuclease E